MASTFETQLAFRLSTRETLDSTSYPSAAAKVVTHDSFDVTKTLNASSSPTLTFASHVQLTSGTSGTIDLTSLTTLTGTLSATGLKLHAIRIHNGAAGLFTMVTGASNAYAIGTNQKIVVPTTGDAMFYFAGQLTAVGAGAKNLDWTAGSAPTTLLPINITLLLGS